MMGRKERGSIVLIGLAGAWAAGLAVTGITWLIAASSTSGGGYPTVPVISISGGAVTVASLAAWIVRKLILGEVTPTPITKLMEDAARREEKQDRIIEMLLGDRSDMKQSQKESTQAMFAVNDYLRRSGSPTGAPPAQRASTT